MDRSVTPPKVDPHLKPVLQTGFLIGDFSNTSTDSPNIAKMDLTFKFGGNNIAVIKGVVDVYFHSSSSYFMISGFLAFAFVSVGGR